ncbi:MAG TPA: FHA domain-containing protein [Solirubrobacteraceae bacterium]|nr:FHA domain-containing protein [Solirubrobacteraceae bacterium]
MESLSAGTFVGAGSFRCQHCGYALTLEGAEALTACPSCGGQEFIRASLFKTERSAAPTVDEATEAALVAPAEPGAGEPLLEQARGALDEPGDYLAYEENGQLETVALTREWTRIGRSLAADLRFDDPTVSRRHALIVQHPEGVRLLDDRSLNGVFVNGERIDGRVLEDGDELIVGRYRLRFLKVQARSRLQSGAGSDPVSSIG